jgi:hypothetical protein
MDYLWLLVGLGVIVWFFGRNHRTPRSHRRRGCQCRQ